MPIGTTQNCWRRLGAVCAGLVLGQHFVRHSGHSICFIERINSCPKIYNFVNYVGINPLVLSNQVLAEHLRVSLLITNMQAT